MFGTKHSPAAPPTSAMDAAASPFAETDADRYDPPEDFVPAHLPAPGPFLAGHDVLEGADHVEVHRLAAECFETRGVYDVTFGYNLAQLNLDRGHPDAGFRYARDRDDPSVLRAEFTPTTPFCPQAYTLAAGAFRALNGEADRHDFALVCVRVAPMHHASEGMNADLEALEDRFAETGSLAPPEEPAGVGG